ncbi:MAG TPA: ATP synthase F0 subunit C, partial [Planctomycetota bacterium]|nr:ATP synthase F0 subunit C [Planctomycetota bacterium]
TTVLPEMLAQAAETGAAAAGQVADQATQAADQATQAADAVANAGWADAFRPIGRGLGAGLASLGAAWGIGRIAATSVESIARQPDASGDIRGAMILTSAFIEGVCLFAVVVALLT